MDEAKAKPETSDGGAPRIPLLQKLVGKSDEPQPVKKNLGGRPSNAEREAKLKAQTAEETLREMFSDEVVEELITLYPDLRFAMTGSECFNLDEQDKKVLVRLTKPCASLIPFKPEYVSMALMVVAMGKIYGSMEIAYKNQNKALKTPEKKG